MNTQPTVLRRAAQSGTRGGLYRFDSYPANRLLFNRTFAGARGGAKRVLHLHTAFNFPGSSFNAITFSDILRKYFDLRGERIEGPFGPFSTPTDDIDDYDIIVLENLWRPSPNGPTGGYSIEELLANLPPWWERLLGDWPGRVIILFQPSGGFSIGHPDFGWVTMFNRSWGQTLRWQVNISGPQTVGADYVHHNLVPHRFAADLGSEFNSLFGVANITISEPSERVAKSKYIGIGANPPSDSWIVSKTIGNTNWVALGSIVGFDFYKDWNTRGISPLLTYGELAMIFRLFDHFLDDPIIVA